MAKATMALVRIGPIDRSHGASTAHTRKQVVWRLLISEAYLRGVHAIEDSILYLRMEERDVESIFRVRNFSRRPGCVSIHE